MVESRDPDPNVTVERKLQLWKQYLEIVSTDAGMQIDRSDEQAENASCSMFESREPVPNVTLASFLQ
jgi:hypothetical protein